jgi:glycine betaine/proline transport system permease protein
VYKLPVGKFFESIIDWLTQNLGPFFDIINSILTGIISTFETVLLFIPPLILIALMVVLAWRIAGKGVAIFSIIGLLLIHSMGFWEETMITLALVVTSGLLALIIGIPVGIWASRKDAVENVVRPILDFMQTMPAFVYLIPAVLFFQLGKVPGAVATVIFAMPPAVRLTNLGIRQVQKDVVEAARAFGSTSQQLLFKVQLCCNGIFRCTLWSC